MIQMIYLRQYIGVWPSIGRMLVYRLPELFKDSETKNEIVSDGRVKIKISGDDATKGKKIHVVILHYC